MSEIAASAAASHIFPSASTAVAWRAQGFWTSELAKGLPAAFVALIIGIIAAGIAWRQAKIATAKLKLDLFEQRFAIYLAVWRAVSAPGNEGANLSDEVTGIANLPSQTAFLFGVELGIYVMDVRNKLARYVETGPSAQTLYESTETRDLRSAERSEARAWFADEAAGKCHERFRPYLDFSAWR